jgi:hypothetical protein
LGSPLKASCTGYGCHISVQFWGMFLNGDFYPEASSNTINPIPRFFLNIT